MVRSDASDDRRFVLMGSRLTVQAFLVGFRQPHHRIP